MKVRTKAGFEFSKDGIKEGTSCPYCGSDHKLTTEGDEQIAECKFCLRGRLYRVGLEYQDGRNRYVFNGDSFFVDHL